MIRLELNCYLIERGLVVSAKVRPHRLGSVTLAISSALHGAALGAHNIAMKGLMTDQLLSKR